MPNNCGEEVKAFGGGGKDPKLADVVRSVLLGKADTVEFHGGVGKCIGIASRYVPKRNQGERRGRARGEGGLLRA